MLPGKSKIDELFNNFKIFFDIANEKTYRKRENTRENERYDIGKSK